MTMKVPGPCPLIQHRWDQTQCADPRGTGKGNSNAVPKQPCLAYLKAREIFVERVRFREDSSLYIL